VLNAVRSIQEIEKNTCALVEWIKTQEQLMVGVYGGPIENLRILEIGPGQGMQRARYFGLRNDILGMDLDLIKEGYTPRDYLLMWKKNGLGRVLKTMGWQALMRGPTERAWAKVLGSRNARLPEMIYGDICSSIPEENAFDMVMSWSVFEHLGDPKTAIQNIIKALKPGGAFFISIHLYTSINGHHDIRAFTGGLDQLPLWGHLRDSTRQTIRPSAYLNQWRLADWRRLFDEVAPGSQEILEAGDVPEKYGPTLTGGLRQELSDYTAEELINVNALYLWKKPTHQPVLPAQQR
jgi:SAM-dependent methyltransferase